MPDPACVRENGCQSLSFETRSHDPRPQRRELGHVPEFLLCPLCQISLEERLFGERSDVYVDRCTACRGTWLDRGELVLVKRVSVEQDVWRNAD